MDKELKYNVHNLLWDLFRIKSNFLCRHGYHNYVFKYEYEMVPEVYIPFDPESSVVKRKFVNYHGIYHTYYKCACCGKEIVSNESKL